MTCRLIIDVFGMVANGKSAMDKQLQQLRQFHQRFACHIEETPTAELPPGIGEVRARLMQEELDEYREALAAGDLVGIADALSDLLYVVMGTYLSHGLQDKAERLFDEVHRSNMSKLDEHGQPKYRADGKVLKSELYLPPDLAPILIDDSE